MLVDIGYTSADIIHKKKIPEILYIYDRKGNIIRTE